LFGSRLEPNHEPYLFEPVGQTWKTGPQIPVSLTVAQEIEWLAQQTRRHLRFPTIVRKARGI
jgi:hypothetical protein